MLFLKTRAGADPHRRWTSLVLTGLLSGLLAGCGDEGQPPAPTPPLVETPTQGNLDDTPTATPTQAVPTPTTPGGTPTTPGGTPTTPGGTPTTPGGTPTQPGETPTTPGGTPTLPGQTPTDPGQTPTASLPPITPTDVPEPTLPEGTPIPVPTGTPLRTPTPGVTPPPGPTPTDVAPTPTAPSGPTPTDPPAPTAPPTLCGNGQIDAGETCDDSNRGPDDGCSPTCQVEPDSYCSGTPSVCVDSICGDGEVAPDEACDEGDDNSDLDPDACRTDCTLPDCGDGVKDAGELCDEGLNNSDDDPNSCRTDCTLAGCGDGIKDLGEQCDLGPDNSDTDPDTCRTNCTLPRCSDGVKDSGEQCDEGAANSNTAPDACRRNCKLPTCGDAVTDSDEGCDDGAANSDTTPDACRTNCEPAACGDGIEDTGEQCDEGAANSDTISGACRTSCRSPSCGDGVVDAGETCDNGAANSNTVPGACRTDCDAAFCGDGIKDPGEECDSGAANSDTLAGACRTDCDLPTCGDGVKDPGEGCDDGDQDNTDACNTECAPAACGDGFVQPGEECDNGAANSDTAPNACRTTCVDASCGDDVVDSGELCDDGAQNSDTQPGACRAECVPASCGDDVVDPGEACDDGPLNGDDGACSATCDPNIDLENVMSINADGTVASGSWDDFFDRITEQAADCKVRFNGRVARVEHVEYNTGSVYLDFQPLEAYHDSYDAYAYIHLNKNVRAGLGTSYRRGHGDTVDLKDRSQYAEAEWRPMPVDVFCPAANPYTKVASFDTRGRVVTGSFDTLRELVVERGATCKVRSDKRVMRPDHIEFGQTRLTFDLQGLAASHDTWDAYAYVDVNLNVRAGIGTNYRRGHGTYVHLRDTAQHAEAKFTAYTVDVYCADDQEPVATVLRSGTVVDGDWDDLWNRAALEGRTCKVQWDGRIATAKYTEHLGGKLRFDFAPMHAYHDSWDAYAFAQLIEGGQSGIGTSYRRGRYNEIYKQSYAQHTGGLFVPAQTKIFCEKADRWEPVFTLSSSGQAVAGDWDDFYDLVVNQAADCKVRFDGRTAEPVLAEYVPNYLLLDHANLAAMHNSWDAYLTHVLSRGSDSGISGSYRRGHDDNVWMKDRDQYALFTLQPMTQEFLCRRPGIDDGPDPDCGNGRVDAGEECDAGSNNSDTRANACRTTCELATCGDGVKDTGEECDAGDANSNAVGAACSTTCTLDLEYEQVLSMTADGTVVRGDWDAFYNRLTEGAADCKVRFDNRVSRIEHVEYNTGNVLLDFQPLSAYHNSYDAYAYINLVKGSRAGLGTTYRRGHADTVWMKDRSQYAEAEWKPMTVDVFCARTNPYTKVASFNATGEIVTGSWSALYDKVVSGGAECKVRVDKRIARAEHIEYGPTELSFDLLGLDASHDTWDAYAYVNVQQNVRAGLGASYRRGHGSNVWMRDRRQHAEAAWSPYPVDVFCADSYEEVLTILPNGEAIDGDWDELYDEVTEDLRSCKVRFDNRLANVPYVEYFTGDLRMEFTGLHAYHDSWDSFAYALVSQNGRSGYGSSYRRGRYNEIYKRSRDQHTGAEFYGRQMTVLCEKAPRWEHVLTLSYQGDADLGDWDETYDRIVNQAADCKVRFDGRVAEPWHVEYADQDLLLDHHGLAAMHNSWDAYAINVLSREDASGISGSYRRGHDDNVWMKDRDQYALYTLQSVENEVFCRRPASASVEANLCGNGRLDLGEECDAGAGNSNTGANACRTDCSLASCGDGVVDAGEACDLGAANSDDVGSSCSTTCSDDLEYERVLRMSANGVVLAGSWSDLYTRVTEGATDCKVRFDERVAKVAHVEYSTNNLYLDFQGLSAYHNAYDAYAYVHLQNGYRAGIGTTYRRGHADTVWKKDREQYAEAEWKPMTVDVLCRRDNPYVKVASYSSSGALTAGSLATLDAQVRDFGADCKVRVDRRIMTVEHIELGAGRYYFDALGLNASHDTWDAYAYVDLQPGVRAGLGASYRRGHGTYVHLKDREQHAEAAFNAYPVDVFCADRYDPVLTVAADGTVTGGDWDDLFTMATEEGRTCKVLWDNRIIQVPYTEFFTGELRMEFTGLHAYHDSWDSFAYARLSGGDYADVGTSYRRGRHTEVYKRSTSQHTGALLLDATVKVFCESEPAWDEVLGLAYDGSIDTGSYAELYRRVVDQGADCKVRFDGRIAEPPLVEYREGDLLMDHHGLAAMHNSWDAYATHQVRWGDPSGITGSLRRGHDDNVWMQDRDQYALNTLVPYDQDFLCR